MPPASIKVLIVEDSAVARDLLTRILSSVPEIRVMQCVNNGLEALAVLAECLPDVITMDIHMPGLDGYEVTRRIMETQPVPIIIVSSAYNPDDVTQTFRAMEAGAVAAVEKPPGPGAPDHERMARTLTDMVKAMAEVRVVKRWPHARASVRAVAPAAPRIESSGPSSDVQIVVIGASTGGPPVIEMILSALPKPFPVPLLIVQHISSGFVQGLAEWLTQRTGIPVCVAEDGDRAQPGRAYLAPDGSHLTVGTGGRIHCRTGEPENGLQPAVSCLFRSAIASYGRNAVGVLLTGMGRDGANELKLLRDIGGVTIAQDKESSIVHGMPGAAVELGGATHILPPGRIAEVLCELVAPRTSIVNFSL
jgi:two-component system chemotaxis response regulator CheB